MSLSGRGLVGRLVVYGWSHHTASLQSREALTLSPEQTAELRAWLASQDFIKESALLATCNRFEIYVITSPAQAAFEMDHTRRVLLAELSRVTGWDLEKLDELAQFREDADALRHLFRVAAGLDSQMVGETEILGQVKKAYQEAVADGSISSILHRAFQKSLQQGKWARSQTAIGRGNVSVSTVASELAVRIFGNLSAISLLMVGTGEVAEQSLKVFHSEGCSDVRFCGRNHDRLMALAGMVSGGCAPSEPSSDHQVLVHPLEDLETALMGVDVVLCSTASDHPLITPEMIDRLDVARRGRPLFIIDVAMPRDVDPQCGERDNIFLYNLDDLAAVANENLELRCREVEVCEHHLGSVASEVAKQLGLQAAC